MDYDAFIRLRKSDDGNSSLKPYYAVENFKISIKREPTLFYVFKYQALW